MFLYDCESFVCPVCGESAEIEQVSLGAEVHTRVRWIDDTGSAYDCPQICDALQELYICNQCGAVFASDEDELREKLRSANLTTGEVQFDEA